ncbi:methyltransferase family protein [Helicobacter pullorum]|uniref:methyltransferase family protein n=1 Tax=Helicobacter pullorum TaxID=35818 RepID=UPI000816AACF|nr:isoprenylcysteine carboxylmethyltransferase family protein [Helicobacter pullorum]OCR16954.1 hypothetical protein BA915_02345 [Helicobacter pullorum]
MKLSKNIFGYFVGIFVFLCLIPVLIYLVSTHFVAPIDSFVAFVLAYLCIFVGVVFMLWSNIYMVRVGRGCPTDGFNVSLGERTKKLLIAGPYRFTRNPMLFGTFVFYLGLALLCNSYYALLIPIIFITYMLWHIKKFEEPRLQKDFKEEYLHYKRTTPLLFPKIKLGK